MFKRRLHECKCLSASGQDLSAFDLIRILIPNRLAPLGQGCCLNQCQFNNRLRSRFNAEATFQASCKTWKVELVVGRHDPTHIAILRGSSPWRRHIEQTRWQSSTKKSHEL